MTREEILHSFSLSVHCHDFYVCPDIPPKKLRNAVSSYGQANEPVLALYDGTVFGSAREGILFTESGIFYHYVGERWSVSYDDIQALGIAPNNEVLLYTCHGDAAIHSTIDTASMLNLVSDLSGVPVSESPAFPPASSHTPPLHPAPHREHINPPPPPGGRAHMGGRGPRRRGR